MAFTQIKKYTDAEEFVGKFVAIQSNHRYFNSGYYDITFFGYVKPAIYQYGDCFGNRMIENFLTHDMIASNHVIHTDFLNNDNPLYMRLATHIETHILRNRLLKKEIYLGYKNDQEALSLLDNYLIYLFSK